MCDNSIINDVRSETNFKGITFSVCSKAEVIKILLDNILKSQIEPACHWCAELVCSGHFMEIWETILFYLGKHIHLGNPKIVIYLKSRYDIFQSIIDNGNY